MARVGVVLHGLRTEASVLAMEAGRWLEKHGHEMVIPENDAVDELAPWATPDDAFAALDLALSLGGDGTMLRTVALVAAHDVPVLGVNVGHLGYLNEVEPPELEDALERFFRGDYSVERRMTLDVSVDAAGRPAGTASHLALNEAVLEKTVIGHTVRMAVEINGSFFTTYAADGMIVSTPTGSTAYNFSARGPIVSPRVRALLMTPVSPHMLFDWSLVLDGSEMLRLEVIDGRAAGLAVDGQPRERLEPGDSITCRAGGNDALLVTFGRRNFHGILKSKFSLADR